MNNSKKIILSSCDYKKNSDRINQFLTERAMSKIVGGSYAESTAVKKPYVPPIKK